MRKLLILFSVSILLSACSSDVKFNNPGFQARKDNFNWKADVKQFKNANGFLTLKAFLGPEIVTMKVVAPLSSIFKNNPVSYTFGITDNEPFNENEASYTTTVDGVILEYVTNTEVSNGQLIITSFDFATKKLSGTFRFNATYQGVDPQIAKNVNFQEGNIYEVPVF
jgi:hypothetical protein